MPKTEWHTMKPVGAGYLDHAPTVWRIEERVAAPRPAVWDAFADASTWNQWFPHVEWARYESPAWPARSTTRPW